MSTTELPTTTEIGAVVEELRHGALRVGVFGEFSAGKSCFLNAILGEELLSVATEPTTATATRIIHARDFNIAVLGPKGKLLARLFDPANVPAWARFVGRGSAVESLRPHTSLIRDFLREWTTEGKQAGRTGEVLIEVPHPLLKGGLALVDTPGANNEFTRHHSITERIASSVDVAICLLDARQGGKRTELQFVGTVAGVAPYTVVVANKLDMIDPDEREDVLLGLQAELSRFWPEGRGACPEPRGCSALAALDPEHGRRHPGLATGFAELIQLLREDAHHQRGRLILARCGSLDQRLKSLAREAEARDDADLAHTAWDDASTLQHEAGIDDPEVAHGVERSAARLKTKIEAVAGLRRRIESALNGGGPAMLTAEVSELLTEATRTAEQLRMPVEGLDTLEKARRHYAAANDHLQQERWELAQQELKKYLRCCPHDDEATRLSEEEIPACIARREAAKAAKADLRRAKTALEKDDFERAIDSFDAYLAVFPEDAEVRSLRDGLPTRIAERDRKQRIATQRGEMLTARQARDWRRLSIAADALLADAPEDSEAVEAQRALPELILAQRLEELNDQKNWPDFLKSCQAWLAEPDPPLTQLLEACRIRAQAMVFKLRQRRFPDEVTAKNVVQRLAGLHKVAERVSELRSAFACIGRSDMDPTEEVRSEIETEEANCTRIARLLEAGDAGIDELIAWAQDSSSPYDALQAVGLTLLEESFSRADQPERKPHRWNTSAFQTWIQPFDDVVRRGQSLHDLLPDDIRANLHKRLPHWRRITQQRRQFGMDQLSALARRRWWLAGAVTAAALLAGAGLWNFVLVEQLAWRYIKETVDVNHRVVLLDRYLAHPPVGARIAQATELRHQLRWQQAQAEHTPEEQARAIMIFLKEYPRSPHQDEAKRRIDDTAWSQADVAGSPAEQVARLTVYVETFPAGTHLAEARERLREARWAEATQLQDPVQALPYYERFHRDFPDAHAAELGRLIDDAVWRQASAEGKQAERMQRIRAFLAAAPRSPHVAEATELLHRLRWTEANSSGVSKVLSAFLADYPASPHRAEAQRLFEDAVGAEVTSIGDLAAVTAFLAAHPNSTHREAAQVRLHELRWKQAITSEDASETPRLLRAFFADFPGSPHRMEAIQRLDDAAWAESTAANQEEAYEAYLKEFSQGRHADQARARHKDLTAETEKLLAASCLGRREDIELFVGKYPRHQRTADLQAVLEIMPHWCARAGRDEYGIWADLQIGNVVQRFRLIKPGTFLMGSPKAEQEGAAATHAVEQRELFNRLPGEQRGKAMETVERLRLVWFRDEVQRKVTLTRGFWIADSECTQAMWQEITDGQFKETPHIPVNQVSWEDCQKFLARLNALVPKTRFSLPSEAQWEYACRAGTSTSFNVGAIVRPETVNCTYNQQQLRKTVTVRSLPPNAWGLYEMHGNVAEWCNDMSNGRVSSSGSDEIDPTGPATGFGRVIRGGSYLDSSVLCRSATRVIWKPDLKNANLGFRISTAAAP